MIRGSCDGTLRGAAAAFYCRKTAFSVWVYANFITNNKY